MTNEQPTSRRAAREVAASAPADGAAAAPRGGGLGALLRKHPTAWIVSAAAVVFVLLGTGSVFAGVAWASRDEPAPNTPSPTVTTEDPRPVSTLPAVASRLRTCSIAGPAADGRLMTLQASVMRADTGEVLFDRGGGTPSRTASVLKLFTAAAAISALGPDFQITTSVVTGSSPGTIVLVGRGDATLSALPAGQESVYKGAPKLQTLAEQTVAAYAQQFPGTPITQVVLDASYWNSGDKWDPTWHRTEQTTGYQSEVTALQVDGDRADPRASKSPRSTDPIARAGAAFIEALHNADTNDEIVAPDVSTLLGTAVSTTTLAEVKSQPLRVLIPQMLLPSDNTLGEMLARIVSRETGMNGSASSLQQAIPSQLAAWNVPTAGLVIRDGSGLSDQNAVPPAVMSTFLRQVRDGTNGLDVVRDGLGIAGKSGTVAGRFTGDNAVARGNVWAKSGSLENAFTLAGYLNAADGTPITFTFYALGDGIKTNARDALDTLTTAVFRCGDNLSNN